MRNPSKFFLSLSWVGWLNILLLQWAFMRLGYGTNWAILFPIVPLTGWWGRYVPQKHRVIVFEKDED